MFCVFLLTVWLAFVWDDAEHKLVMFFTVLHWTGFFLCALISSGHNGPGAGQVPCPTGLRRVPLERLPDRHSSCQLQCRSRLALGQFIFRQHTAPPGSSDRIEPEGRDKPHVQDLPSSGYLHSGTVRKLGYSIRVFAEASAEDRGGVGWANGPRWHGGPGCLWHFLLCLPSTARPDWNLDLCSPVAQFSSFTIAPTGASSSTRLSYLAHGWQSPWRSAGQTIL